MKVLIFYQYFGTPAGGWSTRVYEFARRWVELGHQVVVVTSPYDKSDLPIATGLITKYNFDGIEVIAINQLQSNKHSFLRRLFTFFSYSIVSTYYALGISCDVIIASSGPITVGIPALAAKLLRRRPYIFEVRDLWPRGAEELGIIKNRLLINLAYKFESLCYRVSNCIVTCSVGMAEDIQHRFPKVRPRVVPNVSGITMKYEGESGSPPPWTTDKNIFLYAGSIGVMDDCSQIVDAAIELESRNDDKSLLVVIGEGSEKSTLIERTLQRKLRNLVFLDLMPKVEVFQWLNLAVGSLVVFKDVPVLDTSSPNKLFDCFAAGKPIIQTTQGWIQDVLEEHQCGINVTPGDPLEMADAVQLLGNNPQIAFEMGEKSRMLGENEFNLERISAEYLSLLQQVAKNIES